MTARVTDLERIIAQAFSKRERPLAVVPINCPPTTEYADAAFFEGKDWKDLVCSDLDKCFEAMSGFSPEAFCYFLPGVFCAGIRENRPNMIVNDGLITGLDRSNMPSSWDTFFAERWPRLTAAECEATQRWIMWLSEFNPPVISDHSLSRAFDTVTLLANLSSAIPLASR